LVDVIMKLTTDRKRISCFLAAGLVFVVTLISLVSGGLMTAQAQIPTGSVPTVTGTFIGALAIVQDNEQGIANVRAGPNAAAYEIIGVLVVGQEVPALGRSPGGDWIQIAYPGVPGGVAWIWKDLVEVRGALPIIDPPPTPTPRVTPTIDPTLAAQFLVEIPPTRLPTFTAPPPVSMPTFPVEAPITQPARIPMGLIIIGMAVLGLTGTLISFLRGR
jgi:hypothetical protein